ncbi:MAG: ribosomal RNA small subunit methyltransferase A, partial [Simkaniaceae bacterium]|nr:ribosomal RNA small subunit methyltransferase A [Simkaniaceae bacterium]
MSHQLYRPSSLLAFLSENTVYPKKHLSQNFLIDGNIIKKIILAAAVKPNDLIVEIGPGPGVLTEALLQKGATVIAIEKDTLFANKLHRLAEDRSKLTVYSQDILTFPLEETLKNYPDKQVKVISNLPYHLTSPIIEKLIPLYQIISTLTLMVQKEVGKRCTAEVNSKNYSSFPLFLQYYSTPKYLFSVSASCFLPKPKVDSAI